MSGNTVKKTISFKRDSWEYVSRNANGNASKFINQVLLGHRNRLMRRAMIDGYKAMASNRQMAADLRLWDLTLMDGMTREASPTR